MATLRIDHGTVLTLNPERHVLKDGSAVIDRDCIVAVGKTADLVDRLRQRGVPHVGKLLPRRPVI